MTTCVCVGKGVRESLDVCVCVCLRTCVFPSVWPEDYSSEVVCPGFRSAWKARVLGYVIALTRGLTSCL